MRISHCRSCDAEVIWCHTAKSKIPMDAKPIENGNLVILYELGSEPTVESYHPGLHLGQKRYQSHFVSCPQANQHRKGAA